MPSQTEHHVGGTKHFECRVNGYPRPTITWYKDGKDITNSSRYNFDFTNDGVISLVIPNITAEDEGHYRCRAENSEGLASTSAYLLVRECRDDRRETTSRSIHSMQIDELIVYRERKKISRENIEQTFETYFETKDKDSNKNIYDEMQNQNLKSIEKLMDTKSELISTSANKFEEESKKISVDMREKKYEIAEKVKSSTLIKEAELQEIQGKVPGKDISSGKTSSQSSSEDEGLILDNSLMFYSSKNVTSSTLASRNSLQQNDLKESKDARLKQKYLEDYKKSTKIDITELHTTDLSTCTEESYIEDVDVIGSESETGSSVDSVVSVDIGISKARFTQDAKSSNTTSFSEMGNVIMEEKNSNVHKTSWVEKLETNEKASVDKYLEDSRPETNEIEFTDRSRNLCASMEKPIIFQTEENVKMEAGKTLKLQARVEAAIRPEITWSKDGEKLKDGKRVTMITDDDVYSMTIQHVEESDAGVYRITAINTAGTVYSDFIVNIVAATTTTNSLDVSTISAAQSLQFSIRPDSMAVLENESLKLSCALTDLGKTEAKISWEKNGKMLKNSEHVQLYETQGIYYLEIPKAKYEDAGEYMCVAENNEGRITATVVVNIQGTESSAVILDEQGAEDLLTHAIPSANDGAIGCSLDSSSDEFFLKSFMVLIDYAAPDSSVTLSAGEIVEVLDSKQKSGMWLVRGIVDKEKICFVPSCVLCTSGSTEPIEERRKEDTVEAEITAVKKKDRKLTHSPKYGSLDGDTSEDEFRLRGTYPDYIAIADYMPPDGEKNSVRLSEGQIVEIIDRERADIWFVQTRPTKNNPSKQGWVPSAYLEEKSVSAQFMRRSTRETFREEVLQVKNKQQEAGLKRR